MQDAERASYSQHGEDAWIVRRLPTQGYFVEVGAFNGVDLSNTLLLERAGWDGLLIEPNPVLAAECRKRRQAETIEVAAVSPAHSGGQLTLHVPDEPAYGSAIVTSRYIQRAQHRGEHIRAITVPGVALDELLQIRNVTTVDFISIDVEGCEADVLEGFDLRRWRPRLVLVESQGLLRDAGVRRLLSQGGYVFSRRFGVNHLYRASTAGAPLRRVLDRALFAKSLAARAVGRARRPRQRAPTPSAGMYR